MGQPAIYPFEKLPVYHNTNTLAYLIGCIIKSRTHHYRLDQLDAHGQALVNGVKAIGLLICMTNVQSDVEHTIESRQQACDLALEATRACRAVIQDFTDRKDGDPIELGRAFALTEEIERGLLANRRELKPGFDPAKYAARYAVAWPIDDRGRPLAPKWKTVEKKKPRER